MASNVANGLSVWLSCSRETAIYKNLSSIVSSNAAPNSFFEPHITLAYMPKLNEKDIEQAVEKTRSLAKQFKPFGAEISNLQTGDAFFKSVFLEVKNTPPLNELRSRAVEIFSPEGGEYKPHISLFYGTNTKEIVSKIENSIKEHNLANSTFPVDRLDLYLSEGTVDKWVHLGSSPLGDDLFFRSALFINNRWENPTKKVYLPVVNPATKQTFHYFPNGTSEDINKAVESSKKAFVQWSQTKGSERAKYLRAIADKIKEKLPSLAKTEVLDNGKPLMAATGDMNDVAGCFEYYANQAEELDKRQNQEIKLPDVNYACQLRFDPVGVAGMIVPWNYPLLMAAWKVAPCLAAGCTGILKPSELTPLTALELGAIVKEVGLPPGVLNIITGLGPDAGQPLSDHPDVDKIAFTGSVPTGSKVMSSASKNIKKVSLELGGKSPFIIFSDSNLDQAVEWIMFGIFANQGQVCSATSRVIVEESIYEKLIHRLVEESKKIKIGFGLEPENILGPVVSEGQYQKVLDYIKKGQEQGAHIAYGGIPKEEQLLKGYFVPPTIFTNVNEKMNIWQEEIFGPVVCMKSFKTEQEALELANNSTYGVAAAVMSKDKERCSRVANALQAGIVWINCSQPTFMEAPWGGMKKSGTGRELGPWGLENYLETKQITSYQDENGLGYEWYIKKK